MLPFLFAVMAPLAERAGIRFEVEPGVGHAARLVYPDGTIRFVRSRILDLNRATSASVAKKRSYVLGFLQEQGIPVPEFLAMRIPARQGEEGVEGRIAEALRFAEQIGYPLAVRSVHRTETGPLLVGSPEELEAVVRREVPVSPRFMLQRVVAGHPLTLVVLDDEVLLAYLHRPEPVPIKVADDVQALAVDVVRRSGLRFAAVDLMLDPPDRPADAPWYVMDVVPDPDLEPYAALGDPHRPKVEAVVEKLLLAMGPRQGARS